MTTELLKERKQKLQQQLERLRNDYNAVLGAIQDCEYWEKQIADKAKEQ